MKRSMIIFVGVVLSLGCQQKLFLMSDASCACDTDGAPVDTAGTEPTETEPTETEPTETEPTETEPTETEPTETEPMETDTGEPAGTDGDASIEGGVSSTENLEKLNGRCIRVVDERGESLNPDGLSWVTAFQDIKVAVAAAEEALKGSNGERCEVWVREGTYRLGSEDPLDSLILSSDIWLLGGFAGDETDVIGRDPRGRKTVLDGEESLFHVVAVLPLEQSEVVENVVIDGFTIRGGVAGGQHPLNQKGAGLFVDEAHLEVRNVTFEDNIAYEGGAVRIFQSSPEHKVVFRNCSFIRNHALTAAVLANYRRSKPRFVNCLFADNKTEQDSSIAQSFGSGLPGFINCTFVGNVVKGLLNYREEAYGFSLFLEDYESGGRSGIYEYDYFIGTTYVANSVFDLNYPLEMFPPDSRPAPVYYSLIQPGALDPVGAPPDNTCIEGHAVFEDPGGGDYRLTADSPGVDRGTAEDFQAGDSTNFVEIPEDDLLGNPRDSRPDMGAYEVQ